MSAAALYTAVPMNSATAVITATITNTRIEGTSPGAKRPQDGAEPMLVPLSPRYGQWAPPLKAYLPMVAR
jgi:hypothetical protein